MGKAWRASPTFRVTASPAILGKRWRGRCGTAREAGRLWRSGGVMSEPASQVGKQLQRFLGRHRLLPDALPQGAEDGE